MLRKVRETGAVALYPGYLGTSTRTIYPDSDIGPALREIDSVVSRAIDVRRNAPVCVIGVSLGGYLAAHLKSAHPELPILALNPIMSSPAVSRELEERVTGRRLFYRRIMKYRVTDDRLQRVGEDSVLIHDIYDNFFGTQADQSLADVLNGRRVGFHIAYSPGDEFIGLNEVPRLSDTLGPGALERTRSVPHNISSTSSFRAFRPAIDRFLDDCLMASND